MKRFFLLMTALLLMLTLSACGEPPTLNTDVAADFSVRYGDADYTGTLTKNADALTVALTAPYTVKGMTFTYRDGNLHLGYLKHSAEVAAGYLPEGGIVSRILHTLPYLPQAEYVETENGVDRFTVPTPSGSARVTAINGDIQTLTVPGGIAFHFQNHGG